MRCDTSFDFGGLRVVMGDAPGSGEPMAPSSASCTMVDVSSAAPPRRLRTYLVMMAAVVTMMMAEVEVVLCLCWFERARACARVRVYVCASEMLESPVCMYVHVHVGPCLAMPHYALGVVFDVNIVIIAVVFPVPPVVTILLLVSFVITLSRGRHHRRRIHALIKLFLYHWLTTRHLFCLKAEKPPGVLSVAPESLVGRQNVSKAIGFHHPVDRRHAVSEWCLGDNA